MPVLEGPGLGFELDWEAVNQAGDLYGKAMQDNG